jgi:hypothetical protein
MRPTDGGPTHDNDDADFWDAYDGPEAERESASCTCRFTDDETVHPDYRCPLF